MKNVLFAFTERKLIKETSLLTILSVWQVSKARVNQKMLKITCLIFSIVIQLNAEECKPTISTASGTISPKKICSGQLIFDENFDELNKQKWIPEVTFFGGGVSKLIFMK